MSSRNRLCPLWYYSKLDDRHPAYFGPLGAAIDLEQARWAGAGTKTCDATRTFRGVLPNTLSVQIRRMAGKCGANNRGFVVFILRVLLPVVETGRIQEVLKRMRTASSISGLSLALSVSGKRRMIEVGWREALELRHCVFSG